MEGAADPLAKRAAVDRYGLTNIESNGQAHRPAQDSAEEEVEEGVSNKRHLSAHERRLLKKPVSTL